MSSYTDRFLLVSSIENETMPLMSFLKVIGCEKVFEAKCAGEAKSLAEKEEIDIAVINMPLEDRGCYDLALELNRKNKEILLIVKKDDYDEAFEKVSDYGIVVITKPVQKIYFKQAVNMLVSIKRRLKRINNENIKLHSKVEEMRLVSRAKGILMKYLGMSESQAHRYIEKQAMDMREPKIKIAQGILKTYEE